MSNLLLAMPRQDWVFELEKFGDSTGMLAI